MGNVCIGAICPGYMGDKKASKEDEVLKNIANQTDLSDEDEDGVHSARLCI